MFKSQIKKINKVFKNTNIYNYDTLEEQVDLWNFADLIIRQIKFDLLNAIKIGKKINKEQFEFYSYISKKNDELAYKIINYVESSKDLCFVPYMR